MSKKSAADSHARARTSSRLTLTLDYNPPSLNRFLRMHWTSRRKEGIRAAVALLSALRSAASESPTSTMLTEASNLLSTHLCFVSSLTTTTLLPFALKSASKKLDALRTKKPKSN